MIAEKYGIAVIEDACQSIGGKYHGKFLGTIGDAGAYSFNYYNAFAEKCGENGLSITIPINTGKHIYTNWTQIMEKRGALHPAMDPFKMKENQGLQSDYTMDMCPKTLDLLARTAYVAINPDWSSDELEAVAAIINNAL